MTMFPLWISLIPFLLAAICVVFAVHRLIRRRWSLAVPLLLLASLFVCFGAWFFLGDIYQRINLTARSTAFSHLPSPDGTSWVATIADMSPSGANNICFYMVGEVREYATDRQEVEEFYLMQHFPKPFEENMHVQFVEGGFLPELAGLSTTYVSQGGLYLVYSVDYGSSALDRRCHM